jgi:hypothetical protein
MKTLQVDFPLPDKQPLITLEYEPGVPDVDVNWLSTYLKDAANSGQEFRSGETLQVGSMLTKFLDAGDKRLVIGEPDMQSMPIHFEPGVSRTLTVLRLQKDVAESLGLQDRIDFASITSGVLVCTELDAQNIGVMDRAATEDSRETGWFVGCRNPSHDHNVAENLQRISIYELMVRIPTATPFLALPVSSSIVFDGRRPAGIWCDGQQATVRPGSLLDQLAQRTDA